MTYNVVLDTDATPSDYVLSELKVSENIASYGGQCRAQYKSMNYSGSQGSECLKNVADLQRKISKVVDHISTTDEYWFFLLEPNECFEENIKERLIDLWVITSLIIYRRKKENHVIKFFIIIVGDYNKIHQFICKSLPINCRITIDWLQEQEMFYEEFKSNSKNKNITVQNDGIKQYAPKTESQHSGHQVIIPVNFGDTTKMNNKYEIHGNNNNIINHSTVENAFNNVKDEHDEEVAKALISIEEAINNSGNKEAVENFESFNEELAKPTPKKSILKTLWKGTLEALPELAKLIDVVSKIEGLFS
ncbi:MAG: hypothetical protein WGN25_14220 [Candidatus Electrothrix sp. GW3-4]|uniref:hypothetical protein n=1 Tax=Candidatus Electrothrix sp. GW3-4 TaxID=3126740 RepID=UPI0030D45A08